MLCFSGGRRLEAGGWKVEGQGPTPPTLSKRRASGQVEHDGVALPSSSFHCAIMTVAFRSSLDIASKKIQWLVQKLRTGRNRVLALRKKPLYPTVGRCACG